MGISASLQKGLPSTLIMPLNIDCRRPTSRHHSTTSSASRASPGHSANPVQTRHRVGVQEYRVFQPIRIKSTEGYDFKFFFRAAERKNSFDPPNGAPPHCRIRRYFLNRKGGHDKLWPRSLTPKIGKSWAPRRILGNWTFDGILR